MKSTLVFTVFSVLATLAGAAVSFLKVDGQWGSWTTAPCSVTCGVGMRMRSRKCNKPSPSGGGSQCTGVARQHDICRLPACELYEDMHEQWTAWSACRGQCGYGTQRRSRACKLDRPMCLGAQTETRNCTNSAAIPPCPVDGGWSEWFTFLPCPRRNEKICQFPRKYHQVKMRFCSEPRPSYGGKDCDGPEFKYTPCVSLVDISCEGDNMEIDKIFFEEYYNKNKSRPMSKGNKAQWSDWQPAAPCSVTCGSGYRNFRRVCLNSHKNNRCNGSSVKTEACMKPACLPATDEGWTSWREVQPCTPLTPADPCLNWRNDYRILERSCINKGCRGAGRMTESCWEFFNCNSSLVTPSPPTVYPTSWGEWQTSGPCSVTCGDGKQRRMRTCQSGDCEGLSTDTFICRLPPCQGRHSVTIPLDAEKQGLSAWSVWSSCDLKCKQTRYRTCDKEEATTVRYNVEGVEYCEFDIIETRDCPKGVEVCWTPGYSPRNRSAPTMLLQNCYLTSCLTLIIIFPLNLIIKQ